MGIPVFQRTFMVRTSVAHTLCRWLSYLTWPTVKGRGSPILPKTETIGDRAKRKRTRMGAWIILFISRRRLCDRFLRFFGFNLCCHLFLLRFFLLGSGSLANAGYALTINLCALLRTVIQGLLQALAGDVLVRL